MPSTAPSVEAVQDRVLDWYAAHQRDLPWRRTRDPYAILVAEVMLQQTQVDRVIPKWHAWLERFPTVSVLAAASRADAIREWQGLGYNLRAVRLHDIAQQVVAEFDGRLPRNVDELLRLKGVGRYTARAVACFAYEEPVSMVDTNVRRVLARVFSVGEERVDRLADEVVPTDAAYPWNQALMDIGATLCTGRRPMCLLCPLVELCGGPKQLAPRRPQGDFRSSTRYVRGRVIDALRAAASIDVGDLIAATGATDDLLGRLVRDGLIEIEDERATLRA